MKVEQLSLIPLHLPAAVPNDVIKELKGGIVSIGKIASDKTLSMTYLDPDHTRAQTIGTYLRDNFTSRLEAAFINKKAPYLRAIVKGQQFKLCVDSINGILYSFPIHRCGFDYVPKGGKRLKQDVRSSEQQQSLFAQQPLGLFIGVTYHEEKGLLEVFLGQLFPSAYKTKYQTNILAILYSKAMDSVDTNKISEHDTEEIAEPVVVFRRK